MALGVARGHGGGGDRRLRRVHYYRTEEFETPFRRKTRSPELASTQGAKMAPQAVELDLAGYDHGISRQGAKNAKASLPVLTQSRDS